MRGHVCSPCPARPVPSSMPTADQKPLS
jgi:hypothetical protein